MTRKDAPTRSEKPKHLVVKKLKLRDLAATSAGAEKVRGGNFPTRVLGLRGCP